MKIGFIKKFLIIILWITILNILISIFYGLFFTNDFQELKDEILFRTNYYSREIVSTTLDYSNIEDNINNVLSKENISIKITSISYYQSSGKLKLNLEFYTNDGQDLEQIMCMLRVCDNENIFYNDMLGVAESVDKIDYLVYTKKLYNNFDIKNLTTMKVDKKITGNIYYSNVENYKNVELDLDLEDNYEISNELNIKILDLIYTPAGDFSYKPIEPLGEFKFTIKF